MQVFQIALKVEVFENDLGTWNVSLARYDCLAGKHQAYVIDVAEAHAASINVEVDQDKIDAMVADPNRLAKSPPLILVMQNGMSWVIDGHHRLRASHRLGIVDCTCWVIEECDAARYRMRKRPPQQ